MNKTTYLYKHFFLKCRLIAVNASANLFLPFCFPAQVKPVKPAPKSHARGVVFEEVLTIGLEEDELLSEPKAKISLTMKSKYVLTKLTTY